MTDFPPLEPLCWLYVRRDPSSRLGYSKVLTLQQDQAFVDVGWAEIPLVEFSMLVQAQTALSAVEAAMLRDSDGKIMGHGWSITQLNKARPLICAFLDIMGGARHG